jgi:carotenoid cleavage dioxygenase
VLKYDLVQGTSERHSFGPGRCGGEAVFVPRPGGRSEDDGWLLNYIYDQATGKSEALVLDAQDIEGEPTARVLLPTRVPYGFHGTWIDAGRLSSSEP